MFSASSFWTAPVIFRSSTSTRELVTEVISTVFLSFKLFFSLAENLQLPGNWRVHIHLWHAIFERVQLIVHSLSAQVCAVHSLEVRGSRLRLCLMKRIIPPLAPCLAHHFCMIQVLFHRESWSHPQHHAHIHGTHKQVAIMLNYLTHNSTSRNELAIVLENGFRFLHVHWRVSWNWRFQKVAPIRELNNWGLLFSQMTLTTNCLLTWLQKKSDWTCGGLQTRSGHSRICWLCRIYGVLIRDKCIERLILVVEGPGKRDATILSSSITSQHWTVFGQKHCQNRIFLTWLGRRMGKNSATSGSHFHFSSDTPCWCSMPDWRKNRTLCWVGRDTIELMFKSPWWDRMLWEVIQLGIGPCSVTFRSVYVCTTNSRKIALSDMFRTEPAGNSVRKQSSLWVAPNTERQFTLKWGSGSDDVELFHRIRVLYFWRSSMYTTDRSELLRRGREHNCFHGKHHNIFPLSSL